MPRHRRPRSGRRAGIILVQEIQDPLNLLLILIGSQCYIVLRDHGHFSRNHGNALLLQCLAHCGEVCRGGDDLIAVLFLGEVLSTCIQSHHHELVCSCLILFLCYDDLTLLVKHIGYAAGSTYISATLCKCVTHVGSGTVLVVCKAVYNDGCSGGTITLIGVCYVVYAVRITCSLLDTTIDSIVGHVICLCLCDNITELGVVGRIRSSLLNCYGDLSTDDGEDLSLCCVVLLFLVLDVRKLGMS